MAAVKNRPEIPVCGALRPAGGNSKIGAGQMVLSIPANLKGEVAEIQPGTELEFSTASTPDLKGITSALSGGPILVQNGKVQELPKPAGERFPMESVPNMKGILAQRSAGTRNTITWWKWMAANKVYRLA